MNTTTPQDLAMYGIVAVLVFFVGRVIILWYYKIDERLNEQKETNKLLRELINLQPKPGITHTYEPPEDYNPDSEIDINDPDNLNKAIKKYNSK